MWHTSIGTRKSIEEKNYESAYLLLGEPTKEAEADNVDESDSAQVSDKYISDISDGNVAQEAARKRRQALVVQAPRRVKERLTLLW